MTRIGWALLGLVVLALAAFVSMTRFGGEGGQPTSAKDEAHPGKKMVDHVERVARATIDRFRNTDDLPGLSVPVRGVARTAITDTWGQARSEGRVHHGTDIPAAQGTPVLAAADGTIEKLFPSNLGGTTLYERSSDRRWTFYYAHLAGYAPGLHEGQVVRAGDTIAYVGDTGDAGAGNYHLHFTLTRTTPEQHWYQGEDVNAFPALAGTAPRR